MGYSCTAHAAHRLDAIYAHTLVFGGMNMQGAWTDPKTGRSYFLERGREQRDGSVTGTVFRFLTQPDATGRAQCLRAGSFKIWPDGDRMRGPTYLKNILAYEVHIEDGTFSRFPQLWDCNQHGIPNDQNLFMYVKEHAKSFEANGINKHVSKSLGYVPYPTAARITCLNNGETVAQWTAAPFQVWE